MGLEQQLNDHHRNVVDVLLAMHAPLLAVGGYHGLCDARGIVTRFPAWELTATIPSFGVISGMCASLEPSPQPQGRALLGMGVAILGTGWGAVVYGFGYALGYLYGQSG